MSDKYGYVGLETLLNFCSNQKDHCVTPNDFMRMNRIKIDERPHGEWIKESMQIDEHHFRSYAKCKVCGCSFKPYSFAVKEFDFCPKCGADMREGEAE